MIARVPSPPLTSCPPYTIHPQALYHNRENVKGYGEAFTAGDCVGVHVDFDAGTLSFSRNKKPLGVAFDKICGELYPAVAFYNVGQELEIVPVRACILVHTMSCYIPSSPADGGNVMQGHDQA